MKQLTLPDGSEFHYPTGWAITGGDSLTGSITFERLPEDAPDACIWLREGGPGGSLVGFNITGGECGILQTAPTEGLNLPEDEP